MLSFKQLQEKKTKIKINPKKDEVIESSEVKKNHGEDCDCSKCDKKRRKEDVNDGPDVANEGYDKPDEKLKTDRNMFSIPKGEQDAAKERLKAKAAAKRKAKLKEESAYVSQEEVSEEGYQEGYETETDLTESMKKLPSLMKRNQGSRSMAGRAGMAGSPSAGVKKPVAPAPKPNFMSNMIGGMKGPIGKVARQSIEPGGGNPLGVKTAATSAGGGLTFTNNARLLARAPAQYTRGTVPKPAKEETEIPFLTFNQYQHARTLDEEQLNEFLDKLFGGGKKPANAGGAAQPSLSDRAVGAMQNSARAGNLMGSGTIANTAQDMMKVRDTQKATIEKLLGRSKGGPVKKEEVEISEALPTVSPRGQDGKASGPTGMVQKSINSIGLGGLGRSGPPPTPRPGAFRPTGPVSIFGKPSVPSVSAAPPSKINTSPSTSLAKPISSNMMSKPVAKPAPKKPMIMKKPLPKRPMMNSVSLKTFGSFLKERTRYAKETGKDFKTGNPSEKGGEGRSEVGKSMQKMMRPTGGAMSSRGKAIQPQGKKKDKGAKPKFKSEPTPVDKIKKKLSDKRAPKKDPYGYGQGRYQGD